MSAGAFSDDKVVDAAKKIVPIFVDCDWGKKNNDLSEKYGIRGYPTVIFTDPDGKEVDRVKRRDAASIIAQIDDLAKKYEKK